MCVKPSNHLNPDRSSHGGITAPRRFSCPRGYDMTLVHECSSGSLVQIQCKERKYLQKHKHALSDNPPTVAPVIKVAAHEPIDGPQAQVIGSIDWALVMIIIAVIVTLDIPKIYSNLTRGIRMAWRKMKGRFY